jgi:transcriptional regulator with XRE-family HTH domain
LTVTELAELSNFSKSYISQVKHGKSPPCVNLLSALTKYARPQELEKHYLCLYLKSREAMRVSPKTLGFYKDRLLKFVARVNYSRSSRQQI